MPKRDYVCTSEHLRILSPLGFYTIDRPLGFEKQSLSPPQAEFFYDSDWLTPFSLTISSIWGRNLTTFRYDLGACGAQVRSLDIVLKYVLGPLRALKYARGENTPPPPTPPPKIPTRTHVWNRKFSYLVSYGSLHKFLSLNSGAGKKSCFLLSDQLHHLEFRLILIID